MKKDLKGTQTEKNLMYAFAGESQARNKYDYFASKAKKEGYEQVAAIFLETALNEKEHAKLWFKEFDKIGTTVENLIAAAAGEHEEWTQMYKDFADIADTEGFHDIAKRMRGVAEIEKEHEKRYLSLLENIKTGKVFKRSEAVVWFCRNCGHMEEGKSAPIECPVCDHPQAHFEIKSNNY